AGRVGPLCKGSFRTVPGFGARADNSASVAAVTSATSRAASAAFWAAARAASSRSSVSFHAAHWSRGASRETPFSGRSRRRMRSCVRVMASAVRVSRSCTAGGSEEDELGDQADLDGVDRVELLEGVDDGGEAGFRVVALVRHGGGGGADGAGE